MSEPVVRVSILRKSQPVELEIAEGDFVRYSVKEMNGAQRDEYFNKTANRTTRDASGEVVGMKDYKGLYSTLLSFCLYDTDGKAIPESKIQEWPDTARQLRLAFASAAHFAVHNAVPACFGDEGAANHMRMATAHDALGLELFVYGKTGGAFPARQHEQASRAVARLHGLDPERCLFIEQAPEAIAAGAFHNDVVAVANERVLFTHEQAFADPEGTYAVIRAKLPEAEIVVVPASAVNLSDAIKSYLFNAQLLTLPTGEMGLVIPLEAWETPSVRGWLDGMLGSNGPIRRVLPVDVRQSMANGGGPACLRLRVVADPATVDPRFMLDEAKAALIESVVAAHWPEQIDPADLGAQSLGRTVIAARAALLGALDLDELA
jgi:succinylarginine dihydrolase